MTKYEPLKTFLSHSGSGEVPMRFSEIERIIGASLPPVAFRHRAWWSNNPSNSVITLAWLEAGYKTERVDMAAQRLVFRRDQSSAIRPSRGGSDGVLATLRQSLGGTVRVAEDVDLTAPAGAAWDADPWDADR
jgi:hypothetical protein